MTKPSPPDPLPKDGALSAWAQTEAGTGWEHGDLEPSRIVSELTLLGAAIGRPLCVERTTESTNDDARRAARAGAPTGSAFLADSQSHGRGRLGRIWHSPPGVNLYASFVLRPLLPLALLGWTPLVAGLAIADAIRDLVEPKSRVQIKWPNDVLLDGRKVAGVLSEAEIGDQMPNAVIVGIGINVRTLVFPEELTARATSLALAQATDLDRGRLFIGICEALGRRMRSLQEGLFDALRADLGELDALAGKEVTMGGVHGRASGIDREGCLRVVGDDGVERRFRSGEVLVDGSVSLGPLP